MPYLPSNLESGSGLHIRLQMPRADFLIDVDLQLEGRGITVLFGPSGSGKTSLLRAVAGLERTQSARIVVGHEVWEDDQTREWVPAHRRRVGYVFQEASLFDHLDVMGNLRYGLARAARTGTGQSALRQGLEQAIALLGIEHLLRRRTQWLSGGERQRVAMARALATGPRLLLLDEPLSSLDAARREDILPWLERLRDQTQVPMLYVTHATEELARLADQVVVLHQGRVQSQGPVSQVMADVRGPLAQGEEAAALLMAVIADRSPQWRLSRARFEGGDLWLRDAGEPIGRAVRLRVMARDVSLSVEEPRGVSVQNVVRVQVESISDGAHPSQVLVGLRCGQARLLSRITRRAAHELALQPGSAVWAMVKAVAVVA